MRLKISNDKPSHFRKRASPDPPFKIDTLKDLIALAWNYAPDINTESTFDWKKLWNLIPAMTELDSVVGMNSLKSDVVTFIIRYLKMNLRRGELLHTVLIGPPGTGKTFVALILAKIYCAMGILKDEKIIVAKRSDFVGPFIGHSEDKTMRILESAIGGVLFIDEAYSMGGAKQDTDSFSKAVVDLLNQFLTEHSHECICIIAGYEDELEQSFFSINKGLKRRFPWKFKIDDYSSADLYKIFELKAVTDPEKWSIHPNSISPAFFETHKSHFPYYGGDVEVFFNMCKIAHTKRTFGIKSTNTLMTEDIEKAFETLKSHNSSSIPKAVLAMYS